MQIRFKNSAIYEYPLAQSAKAELVFALKSRGRVPWFGFDVYDGRLVFLNCVVFLVEESFAGTLEAKGSEERRLRADPGTVTAADLIERIWRQAR